jgi:hypothetical protein
MPQRTRGCVFVLRRVEEPVVTHLTRLANIDLGRQSFVGDRDRFRGPGRRRRG